MAALESCAVAAPATSMLAASSAILLLLYLLLDMGVKSKMQYMWHG